MGSAHVQEDTYGHSARFFPLFSGFVRNLYDHLRSLDLVILALPPDLLLHIRNKFLPRPVCFFRFFLGFRIQDEVCNPRNHGGRGHRRRLLLEQEQQFQPIF